ncbi:MAG: HNH endonuclease signature motif containing protein [Pseudonocardiaceae bacterium]
MDAHHIVPWLTGGRTDISNLVLVCRFHHGLIHDHGYRIRWVEGKLEFCRPDGRPIPAAAPPTTGTLEHLIETHAAQQLEITDDSLTPTWSGETLDPDPILLRLLTEPAPALAA